jgi:hypothetical protein
MLWPQLLHALRLAIRPARVVMSTLLLLLLTLLWWLPNLWLDKDATPAHAVSEFTGEAFQSILSGLTSLNASWVVAGVKELFLELPVFLVHHYPWTMALLAVPTILIWTVLGGAITRSAAEEYTQNTRQKWTASLAFSLSRLWSFFFSLVVPILLAGGLAVAISSIGFLLLRAPGVNIAGGAAFGLLLLGGFVLLLVTLAFTIGCGLLIPAVACEGVDAIDATQRTYAYALARPVRTLLYVLVLLLQGLVIAAVLTFLVTNLVHLTAELAGAWLPDDTRRAIYAAATTRHAQLTEDPPFGLSGTVRLVALWCAIPGLIAGAILVSYIFSGTTIMYLLLRRVCDGQDPADLWFPGMVAGTLSHTAAAPNANPATPSPAETDEATDEEDRD